MKRILIFAFYLLLFSLNTVYAQNIFAGYDHLFTSPKQYTTYKTIGKINIDGKLDEASWSNILWSDTFTDIEGSLRPEPKLKTRFKMLWDSQYVYIAAELEEPHIWATIKKRDAIVFYDNDFEIFIDPDGDTHNYFEVEVNAYNTIFDLFLPKPYRSGGPAVINWDVQNLRSAVSIKGKINSAQGIDEKWFVEMAIPFASISLGNFVQVPKDSSLWRINFSRVQWDTDIIDGKYVKKKDSTTHRSLPEHNWVWSPQGVVDMHRPERWGYLHFSENNAGDTTANLPLPAAEELKKYLWLVLYKQQNYRHQNKQFATELSQINIPSLIDVAGLHCSIKLEATNRQFIASIQTAEGDIKWQINQEGKISQL